MKAAQHRTALIAAACLRLLVLPAAAQDYGVDTVPFPANPTSERIVQAWINRYLPTRGYTVGAWSANAVMLVSVDSLKVDAWPQVSTEVLTETLTAKAANAAGWRAALQTMAFDCAQDRYRTLSSLYFARGDRKGRFDQDSGEDVWQTPDAGATMDTVERAACFYGKSKHDAAAQPPAPVSATPAPAPAPASALRHKAVRAHASAVRAKHAVKSAPAKRTSAKHAGPHSAKAQAPPTWAGPPKAAPPPAKPVKRPHPPEVTPQLRGFELQ